MNMEHINELIERKNNLLEKGADQFREINDIARGLEDVGTMSKTAAVQFCKLAAYKLRMLSYTWIDMDDERKVILPEPPTEEEIAEAREAVGDD